MKLIPMPIQSKGDDMQKSYIQVTYRDIAKMLGSALPVEGTWTAALFGTSSSAKMGARAFTSPP